MWLSAVDSQADASHSRRQAYVYTTKDVKFMNITREQLDELVEAAEELYDDGGYAFDIVMATLKALEIRIVTDL